MALRKCFREPIPEIFQAAKELQKALQYNQEWSYRKADTLFTEMDNKKIKDWVESIIWRRSPYIQYREVPRSPQILQKEKRVPIRMPNQEEKRKIHERDLYQCRFCGTPVIRKEVREYLIKLYPHSIRWWKTNTSRHAAFFAMWAQYDHILPHARWWDNSLDNLVLTCTACNFWRMNYTLEEVWIYYPKEFTTSIIPDWNWWEEFVISQ